MNHPKSNPTTSSKPRPSTSHINQHRQWCTFNPEGECAEELWCGGVRGLHSRMNGEMADFPPPPPPHDPPHTRPIPSWGQWISRSLDLQLMNYLGIQNYTCQYSVSSLGKSDAHPTTLIYIRLFVHNNWFICKELLVFPDHWGQPNITKYWRRKEIFI